MEYERQATNFNLTGIKVLIVLALIIFAVFVAVNAHAIARHPDTVNPASQCFDTKGSMQRLINPLTKRNADICFDGIFYIWITTEKGETVTLFGKEKMRTIEQVIKYLNNVGYQ